MVQVLTHITLYKMVNKVLTDLLTRHVPYRQGQGGDGVVRDVQLEQLGEVPHLLGQTGQLVV